MYNLSKLSPKNSNWLLGFSNGGNSRGIAASFAIAKVIADRLSVPSSPVDSIDAYYNMNCKLEVVSQLSQLHEISTVDKYLIESLVFKFINYYYSQIHCSCLVVAINPERAIADIFGIAKYFSEAELEEVKNNCVLVTEVYNNFTSIIRELTA